LLDRAGVTGAPVVDGDGLCIGVLSATDFMHWVDKDCKPNGRRTGAAVSMCSAWQIVEGAAHASICVEDYMTKDPVLVPPSTRIGELARMMMDAHIHRLIVIDTPSQHPIGIVSSMDILAVLVRLEAMQPSAELPHHQEVPAFR